MMHPIDTAPKCDEEVIEISRNGQDPEVVYWDSFYWYSLASGDVYEETEYWPTHWRYLSSSEASQVLQ